MANAGYVRATQSDAPKSPSGALVNYLAAGVSNGNTQVIWPANWSKARALKRLYVGFMWKMNAKFQGYASMSNKLFFMTAFEYVMNGGTGTNGVFSVYGHPDQFPMQLLFSHNSGGLDNSHACDRDAGLACFPNVGDGSVVRDRWYKIEAYVEASSCITCSDSSTRCDFFKLGTASPRPSVTTRRPIPTAETAAAGGSISSTIFASARQIAARLAAASSPSTRRPRARLRDSR